MNSGTTMPASSQNSELNKTNKHIINSSTQLCQLRLGGKQHIAQAQECKRYTKHSQHRRETRWWTPNSRLGARETERRAAVLTLEPQSSASSPAENKSTILGAARSELHIQQAHSLLSSSSSARLFSCWISLLTSTSTQSQPPKLFGGIIHGKGGERRDRKDPGRQPCTLEVAHARQKNIQTSQKISPLVII